MSRVRKTKIVATIGPASDKPDTLREMMEAGMDVARFGFAHGPVDEHVERVRRVQEISADLGHPVGILVDLPGPKIRAGEFPDGGAFLAEGDRVALVPGEDTSTALRVAVDYAELLHDLQPGDWVSLGDGAVRLEVDGESDHAVHATVRHGGRVQGRPGVHLPSERMRNDVPTLQDLDIIAELGRLDVAIDVVALSFVRDERDLARAKEALTAAGIDSLLMAKIETSAAVQHLDAILDVADALMVARGDLGVECPLEEVPHLQKQIIRQCVAFGRPVITATEMLDSMVQAPTPTRAEATDVANAVFDGTDALMLSAETAIGHNPVAAVATMARIATRAEANADYLQWGGRLGKIQRQAALPSGLVLTGAITHAAWQAAVEADAAAIICCTRTGITARAMARFRPTARLIGLTPSPATARQLTLTWGAEPLLTAEHASQEDVVEQAIVACQREGMIEPGQTAVVLTGNPATGGIDALRLVRVPEL